MGANDNILTKIEESIKSTLGEYLNALGTNVSGPAIYKIMQQLDEKTHDVIKSFGQGTEAILTLKSAMADAVTSVQLLGGGLDDVAKIQTAAAEALGRNVVLNSESYAKLYAAQEVSGESAERIVSAFKDAGISAYQASTQMQTVIDSARAIGANAQAVSTMVIENTKELNKYNFAGGVDGLSKMAAQAVSLRIDMKQTMAFAEKVFKPDGAIEMAAAMQRLGVAQSDLLDPLRLMDLSANDPTELQNQIVQMTQQFVQLGKSGHFEIMPGAKRQFQEIASAMGMSYDTLTKMAIGSEELDMKMKKIKFPETFKEDDRKMIANLAEMNDKGSFEVQFSDKKGNLVTKDVTKLDDTDLELLKKSSSSKTLEELTKEQLSYEKDIAANMRAVAQQGGFAVARSKAGDQLYGAKKEITQGFADTFINEATKTKRIAEGINNTMGPAMETFKDLLAGKKSPQDALESLKKSFGKASDYFTEFKTSTLKAGSAASKKMEMSENDFVQMLITVVKKIDAKPPEKKVNDFMIDGQNLITNPADTIFGGTGAKAFLESINKMKTMNVSPPQSNVQNENMNSSHEITFNLKVSSDQNIDMAQLERAFNSTDIQQKITEVATLGMQRYSPEASTRKKMNPYVTSIG
jgi:hypothetical protein